MLSPMTIAVLESGKSVNRMDDCISRKAAIDGLLNGVEPFGIMDKNRNLTGVGVRDIDVIEMLEALPSADAVKVVRCKDCKHWNDAPAADGFNSCEMDALIRHESFFCANGERKGGKQNETD